MEALLFDDFVAFSLTTVAILSYR